MTKGNGWSGFCVGDVDVSGETLEEKQELVYIETLPKFQ